VVGVTVADIDLTRLTSIWEQLRCLVNRSCSSRSEARFRVVGPVAGVTVAEIDLTRLISIREQLPSLANPAQLSA